MCPYYEYRVKSMDSSRITELMAKKIGNAATPSELNELDALLVRYPDYAHLYEIILSLKGGNDHFERNIPKEELVNHGWQDLAGKISTQNNFTEEPDIYKKQSLLIQLFTGSRKWAAVACMLIFFTAATFFYYKKNDNAPQPALTGKIAEAHYGSTSKLVLADGTQVWLNAGSRLIYPDVFASAKREVTLEGEAFFEVTKNAHVPFLVHAGKITVKVLGTRFNVKAYTEDADIETTLISGKVQVTMNNDPEKEIILSPHEKLTVINSPKYSSDKPAEAAVSNELRYQVQELPAAASNVFTETAWLENKLVLSNEDFENVAHLLERKYNVHINFSNNKLKQERLTGVFEKETIQQVLEVLKMTTRFNYRIEGSNIHLY
jgi:transmembrane sensor